MLDTRVDPTPRERLRAAAGPLTLAGAGLLGCAYVAAVDPNTSSAYPFCPFKAMTGLDCVGCGATRSVRALLGGDVSRALDHNVLFTILVPVFVYGWVVWLASTQGVRLPWPRGQAPKIIWPLAAVMMAFWAARLVLGPDAWISSGAA